MPNPTGSSPKYYLISEEELKRLEPVTMKDYKPVDWVWEGKQSEWSWIDCPLCMHGENFEGKKCLVAIVEVKE